MSLRRRALLGWGAAATAGAAIGVTAGPALAATAPAVRRSVLLRYAPDGSLRWHTPVPLGIDERGAEVVAAGGRLFTVQGGALRCFNEASGAPVWVHPVAAVAAGTPLTVGGLVVVVLSTAGGRDARVAAYDQATGRHRWTHDDGADFITLYPLRPGLVIAQERYRTVAVDTTTGRTRWSAPVPDHDDRGQSFAQLATSASTVVQGGLTTTAALDAGTGRRLWAHALPYGAMQPVLTGPVVVLSPQRFGVPGPGGVIALDARTGAHRWTIPSRNESAAVVTTGYGVVVAVTGDTVAGGTTTAVTAATGRVLWSVPVPAAAGEGAPTAITARSVAYIEDLWHDSPGHTHRTIALVNRGLTDGRILYRRPTAEPLPQGPTPRLHSRVLPLFLAPGGRLPPQLRLFDLATHQVRYTTHSPRWPTSTPLVVPDGSLVSLTADPQIGYAA